MLPIDLWVKTFRQPRFCATLQSALWMGRIKKRGDGRKEAVSLCAALLWIRTKKKKKKKRLFIVGATPQSLAFYSTNASGKAQTTPPRERGRARRPDFKTQASVNIFALWKKNKKKRAEDSESV